MFLAPVFRKVVKHGSLTLIDQTGKIHRFGDGSTAHAPVTVKVHDGKTNWAVSTHPELHLGEAYMDGTFTIEEGTLWDFLDLVGSNMNVHGDPMIMRFMRALDGFSKALQQYNPHKKARRNVAHHYDLDGKLYDLFLDKDRQYSCAYFPHRDATLEEAQLAKKRHIASKLLLEPGQHVLDIGCGWGGMSLYLAHTADVRVTGITLSTEQLEVARKRAKAAGLDRQVEFHLMDYRNVKERFDRIVSVGMFEHVGAPHYMTFFRKVRQLMKKDGVALLHSIGRFDPPSNTNAWVRKYIFPGGYVPAMSEVLKRVEKSGLLTTDIEVLRLHYAETLRHWRERFMANVEKARALYDDRFCRMWEFYLAGSEMAFRYGGLMVFQMQFANSLEAVPLTRNYMFDWEREVNDSYQPAAAD